MNNQDPKPLIVGEGIEDESEMDETLNCGQQSI